MSGPAVSSGSENQAAVAAYVAVRMLLQWPLNWTPLERDIPIAIDGEVGGPGDDLRIEFGTSRPPLEVQCKRTVIGKAGLKELVQHIADRLPRVPRSHEVVLTLGAGSSTEVRDTFATDVRNFRSGRRDGMRRITQSVLRAVRESEAVFARLHVVALDVDSHGDSGAQVAILGLRQLLTQPERAEEAWALLVREALKVAQRSRWTRESLTSLLRGYGFDLRPVGSDARWLEQIGYARALNDALRPRTAAGMLDHLEPELTRARAGADAWRQLHTAQGTAALLVKDFAAARDRYRRALEFVVHPSISPRVATAEDKLWLNASYNYSLAICLEGAYPRAEEIAREILMYDERHSAAWSLLTLALGGQDRELELPPLDLRDQPDYRDALAQVAVRREDWRSAIDVIQPVLAAGHRKPLRLVGHALALLNLAAEGKDTAASATLLEQAERTASEAIDALEGAETDTDLARCLFVRGRARAALGRTAEAEGDYDRAARLDPSDPNVLMRAVQARRDAGDHVGALTLLTDEAVEGSPPLRVLRAGERAELKQIGDAVDDLTAALDELPTAATLGQAPLFLEIASLALDLQRPDLTTRSIAALEAGTLEVHRVRILVIKARVAVASGDASVGEPQYREAAAAADSEDARKILGEYATQLSVSGQYERAASVYEEAGANHPAHALFRNYIASLMKAELFERVLRVARGLENNSDALTSSLDQLPRILLDAVIDVAWRQEDYATASRFVAARIAQERHAPRPELTDLLLNGALAHARASEPAIARNMVEEVLRLPELSAENRMRAANVLVVLEAFPEARAAAFMAVRARPADRTIVANFLQVVIAPDLHRKGEKPDGPDREDILAEPDESSELSPKQDGPDDDDVGTDGRQGVVAGDCFVRVLTEDGQRYEYFIYCQPPVDARVNEYLTTDPAVADLIGKQVGDSVIRNAGRWNEQRLRIDRVVPAVVIVFRRSMRTFAAQFPGETPFRVFRVGKNPADSLGQIMATLHQSDVHADEVLALYSATPVPLGVLSKALGKSLIDVVRRLATDRSLRIYVDGPPYTDYASSKTAAENPTAIITRPALEFLDRLNLWEVFAKRFKVIAPRTMMDEWRNELDELHEIATSGRIALRVAGTKPVIDTVPAGAARGMWEAATRFYERVAAVAKVLHRPVSALTAKDDEWRELLGAASFDAIAIARQTAGSLYADDLGLRVVGRDNYGVSSFHTAALLDALRTADLISDDVLESATLQLIDWRHDIVLVRGTTLVAAFRAGGKDFGSVDRVLSRIADRRIDTPSAALVTVGALRELATTRVATISFPDAARRTMAALVAEREPSTVVPILGHFIAQAFVLLPRERRVVLEALRQAVLERRTISDES